MSGRIASIGLDNLFFDVQNPRYDPRKSQSEALATIAHDQGIKLVNLVDDILDKGLNPSDLPIVTPTEDDPNNFIVVEGNRRVAALKLLSSPKLIEMLTLPQGLAKRLKALCERAEAELPSNARQINCVVLPLEDAKYWIQLKHTGENEGVGVVRWDGRASQRFRGTSPALQAIDLVEKSSYIDNETKAKLPGIAITNIERILATPDAREVLGVEVRNQRLVLKSPEEQALQRLAIIVGDVVNRKIKVTQLDTKEQRIDYANRVVAQSLPTPVQGPAGSKPGEKAKTAQPVDRKTLIPRSLKLAIPHVRINKVYWELQHLDVEKFINSCSVMLRVFVELSIDDFAQRKSIPLKTAKGQKGSSGSGAQMVDMNLRQKLRAVVDHLEKQGKCSKDELRGVKALINNREHVLSVDSLNAYVHNKDYNPGPSDLKASWDNIQIFMQRLWSV